MAGLMMVFLFISIALMRDAFLDRDRMRDVAVAYREGQVAIDSALRSEFENDLDFWDAAIDAENLTFEFRSPEVLFEAGSTALRPRFVTILNDFFPRYL
ncbi:MAG: OmpA family protein, partial [Gammaproteobacteria bacterium]|nr:OmpA family protein [Gammaproteobacteria bacterium]